MVMEKDDGITEEEDRLVSTKKGTGGSDMTS